MVYTGAAVGTFVKGVVGNVWEKEGGKRSRKIGKFEPVSLITFAREMFNVRVEISRDENESTFLLCPKTPLRGHILSVGARSEP
jgi:hypothetical protein